MTEFFDKDTLENNHPPVFKSKASICPNSGRIFQLIVRLAARLHKRAGIKQIPVPIDLITSTDGGVPIEVRRLPLKAYHGSVWRLGNSWVIQLNSKDSTARQRFTLYHEIFHVLAHSKAIPVFKKAGRQREGAFNEMLADHFAGACLMPEKLVRKIWPGVQDMKEMARIFDVPEPVVWLELCHLGFCNAPPDDFSLKSL
jgi:Zn-dependent peptidase ImmA (M78 family)